MNYDVLKGAVERWLVGHDLTTDFDTMVMLAENRIASDLRVREMYKSTTLRPSGDSVKLPDDFIDVRAFGYARSGNSTYQQPLSQTTEDGLNGHPTDTGRGTTYWAHAGDYIRFERLFDWVGQEQWLTPVAYTAGVNDYHGWQAVEAVNNTAGNEHGAFTPGQSVGVKALELNWSVLSPENATLYVTEGDDEPDNLTLLIDDLSIDFAYVGASTYFGVSSVELSDYIAANLGTPLRLTITAASGSAYNGKYPVFRLTYWARFPALTQEAPTNALLSRYFGIYLYGILAEAAPYMGDDERVQTWGAAYQAHVDTANENYRRSLIGPTPRVTLENAEMLP